MIYSAGLFDYLSDRLAERLVVSMLAMLSPGGKLMIGNFALSCFGRGYMELFLDWKLIYRSVDQLFRLFGDARQADVTCFSDPHANVIYAEWTCSG